MITLLLLIPIFTVLMLLPIMIRTHNSPNTRLIFINYTTSYISLFYNNYSHCTIAPTNTAPLQRTRSPFTSILEVEGVDRVSQSEVKPLKSLVWYRLSNLRISVLKRSLSHLCTYIFKVKEQILKLISYIFVCLIRNKLPILFLYSVYKFLISKSLIFWLSLDIIFNIILILLILNIIINIILIVFIVVLCKFSIINTSVKRILTLFRYKFLFKIIKVITIIFFKIFNLSFFDIDLFLIFNLKYKSLPFSLMSEFTSDSEQPLLNPNNIEEGAESNNLTTTSETVETVDHHTNIKDFNNFNTLSIEDKLKYLEIKFYNKAIEHNIPLLQWLSNLLEGKSDGNKLEIDNLIESNLNAIQKLERETHLNNHAFFRNKPFLIHKNYDSPTAYPNIIPVYKGISVYEEQEITDAINKTL
uniref:hypothetical protein n=1 Tax=Leucopaxillus giganteus TaxID=1167592 RepID=UPI00315DBF03